MRSLRALLVALLAVLSWLAWEAHRLAEAIDRWEPIRRTLEGMGGIE